MSKTVTIFKPRLDVTFKEGPVPLQLGPIPPIRVHWLNFVEKLKAYHETCGHEVTVVEAPLWQIDLDFVWKNYRELNYIPHKLRRHFNPGFGSYFYHQTVFPDFFTIDINGWGPEISWLNELDLNDLLTYREFDLIRCFSSRINAGISKFNQPLRDPSWNHDNYILFVCQIPHDEIVRYFSDISVEEALTAVLKYAELNNRKVIVKGHPVNPGSMENLRALTNKYQQTYVDHVSIHDCLAKAKEVFLVNSGVGFEACFFPNTFVYRFGDAEYRSIVPQVEADPAAISKCIGHNGMFKTDQDFFSKRNLKFIGQFFSRAFYTGPS